MILCSKVQSARNEESVSREFRGALSTRVQAAPRRFASRMLVSGAPPSDFLGEP